MRKSCRQWGIPQVGGLAKPRILHHFWPGSRGDERLMVCEGFDHASFGSDSCSVHVVAPSQNDEQRIVIIVNSSDGSLSTVCPQWEIYQGGECRSVKEFVHSEPGTKIGTGCAALPGTKHQCECRCLHLDREREPEQFDLPSSYHHSSLRFRIRAGSTERPRRVQRQVSGLQGKASRKSSSSPSSSSSRCKQVPE